MATDTQLKTTARGIQFPDPVYVSIGNGDEAEADIALQDPGGKARIVITGLTINSTTTAAQSITFRPSASSATLLWFPIIASPTGAIRWQGRFPCAVNDLPTVATDSITTGNITALVEYMIETTI